MPVTKLCPHWIPEHTEAGDNLFFSRWKPPFIKVVTSSEVSAGQMDVAIANAETVILRSHPISENWGNRSLVNPEEVAKKHANALKTLMNNVRVAYKFNQSQMDRIIVEGLNEPNVWTPQESPELTSRYYTELIILLATAGIRCCALNIGVGWPGNHGVKDAPPDWTPFSTLVDMIKAHNGYLGIHEYWGPTGIDEGWGWLAGRYKFIPFNVPILITECGLDSRAVGAPDYYGWHGLADSGITMDQAADIYVYNQLGLYDKQLQLDDRIKCALIFTYDFQGREWATFDIRPEIFKSRMINHAGWMAHQDIKTFTPKPLPFYDKNVEWYLPPYNPDRPVPPDPPVPPTPISKAEIIAARWNTEEAIREIERSIKTLETSRSRLLGTLDTWYKIEANS